MSQTHTHVNDSHKEGSTQSSSSNVEIGSVDYDNWFQIVSQLRECGDAEYAVKQATELAARLPGVHAAVGFKRTEDMPLVPVTSLVCRSGIEEEVAKWQTELAPNIRELCSQQSSYHSTSLDNGIELISVAIGSPYHPMAVICIFADTLIESSDSPHAMYAALVRRGRGMVSQ